MTKGRGFPPWQKDSYLGGFLPLTGLDLRSLHRGAGRVPPLGFDRGNQIGVLMESTLDASKGRLRQPVVPGDMPTTRTGSRGVLWWHGQKHAARLEHFVLQQPPEFRPIPDRESTGSDRTLPGRSCPVVQQSRWPTETCCLPANLPPRPSDGFFLMAVEVLCRSHGGRWQCARGCAEPWPWPCSSLPASRRSERTLDPDS